MNRMGRELEVTEELRQRLVQQAALLAQAEAKHRNELQAAEAKVAALQYARSQHEARCIALEEERDGLKQKVQSLLTVDRQCSIGERHCTCTPKVRHTDCSGESH